MSFTYGNVLRWGGGTYDSGIVPPGSSTLSGTQLFVMDSLTAGPGNIQPPPRFIAEKAMEDGRLRNLWVRPILATTQATDTIISSSENTITGSQTPYAPMQLSLYADGTSQTDELTLNSFTFPWRTVRIYFQKKVTGGSFTVSAPVNQVVDITGSDGEIGFVEITNPNGTALTIIDITNITTDMYFTGFLLNISDLSEDYLDIINFAVSGQNFTDYSPCVNIVDWYNELGVDGAVVNAGTNDEEIGYVTTLGNYRDFMDKLLEAGVTGQDVLTMRPNQNARSLGDMWENIRDEYGTRMTSIVAVYGDLGVFQANNWMAAGDNVHPNDTFNEIQGLATYNKELVGLYDALDLGVQPNWVTEFISTTNVNLNEQVTIAGDFAGDVRIQYASRAYYVWDNSDGYENYLYITADGSISLRIDGSTYNSPDGSVTAGWHTVGFSRAGSTITLTVDGVEVYTTSSGSTNDVRFVRLIRWPGGFSIAGRMAWLHIYNQHLWLLNQNHGENDITDQIGSVNGVWVGREDSGARVVKYSIMESGELLDYHYNTLTGIQWGDARWPE